MELTNEKNKLLSNCEVYDMLKKVNTKKSNKKASKSLQNLSTITYETIKYLERTPAVHQNADVVKEFLEQMAPFALTKGEKLLLLNHRPASAVEIQLLVEESEERLSEEQIDQLLEVIMNVLPGPGQQEQQ